MLRVLAKSERNIKNFIEVTAQMRAVFVSMPKITGQQGFV
jgi:hypothetical protein